MDMPNDFKASAEVQNEQLESTQVGRGLQHLRLLEKRIEHLETQLSKRALRKKLRAPTRNRGPIYVQKKAARRSIGRTYSDDDPNEISQRLRSRSSSPYFTVPRSRYEKSTQRVMEEPDDYVQSDDSSERISRARSRSLSPAFRRQGPDPRTPRKPHISGGSKNELKQRFPRVKFERKPVRRYPRAPAQEDASEDSLAMKWIYPSPGTWRDPAHEVVILGSELRNFLLRELEGFPPHHDSDELRFTEPFDDLVYIWDRLQDAVQNDSSTLSGTLREDIKSLMELAEDTEELAAYFGSLAIGGPRMPISFDHLWILFPPGEVIFGSPDGLPQVFLVHMCNYSAESSRIFCWSYDFDGYKFSRQRFQFDVPRYTGKKTVNSLPCYPLCDHEDPERIRRLLRERGTKFRECCTKSKGDQMFHYNGEIAFEGVFETSFFNEGFMKMAMKYSEERRRQKGKSYIPDTSDLKRIQYEGSVMIDVKSWKTYGEPLLQGRLMGPRPDIDVFFECECTRCRANTTLRNRLKPHYDDVCANESGIWPDFEELQLMMCEPRLSAYALSKKTWVRLAVDNVEITGKSQNEAALNHLCLPDDQDKDNNKQLIKSLIDNHGANRKNKTSETPDRLQDFIEGKGQGLVILLHGTSGVGKTLTAESVAEATGRPLLKVSMADIGVDVMNVEHRLDTIFQLASAWEAVLLFDEADILLEARAMEDNLKRNSIVSVFLKVLEYYEGILFLTTNRIKTFDVAVQSRVNLAVHFSDMSGKEQRRVFHMFLNKIDERQIKDRAKIMDWVDEDFRDKFNGRDIRNILSSAIAIARAQGRPLELKDIKTMRDSKRRFKEYLFEQTVKAKQRNE